MSITKPYTALAGDNLFQELPADFSLLAKLETLWLNNCPALDFEKELRKIIPTLQQMYCDTRSPDAYDHDVYEWVAKQLSNDTVD